MYFSLPLSFSSLPPIRPIFSLLHILLPESTHVRQYNICEWILISSKDCGTAASKATYSNAKSGVWCLLFDKDHAFRRWCKVVQCTAYTNKNNPKQMQMNTNHPALPPFFWRLDMQHSFRPFPSLLPFPLSPSLLFTDDVFLSSIGFLRHFHFCSLPLVSRRREGLRKGREEKVFPNNRKGSFVFNRERKRKRIGSFKSAIE